MPRKGEGSKKKSPSNKTKKAKGGRKKRSSSTLDKVRSHGPKRKEKKRLRTYKMPSDEDISKALGYVMRNVHIVRSQTELLSMVIGYLKRTDPDYALTGERLRRVAMDKAGITIEIQGRELDEGRAMSRCPVCRSPLRATKNVTIYGGTVNLGFKCTKCPYWTGKKHRVPTRYIFYLRKKR